MRPFLMMVRMAANCSVRNAKRRSRGAPLQERRSLEAYLAFDLVNDADAVRVSAPPVPVTVNAYVPLAVEDEMVSVSDDEPPVAGFGLKLPLVPAGKPLTDSDTGSAKPPVRVTVTV